MSYSGSVTLVDGLVPANGQDFTLVNSRHVYVDDENRLSDYITEVNERFNVLEYKPITISSFSISPTEIEKGSTVTSIIFNYGLSKTPTTLTIDGQAISNPAASGHDLSFGGFSYTDSHTFVLNATDTGPNGTAGASPTRNATLSFLYMVYCGIGDESPTINDAFLLGLPGTLLASWFKSTDLDRVNNAKAFNANATTGKYIYFALPKSLYSGKFTGSPIFSFNNTDGGFIQVTEFNHINSTNNPAASTTYVVFRSQYPSLGNTTFTVR